MVNKHRLDKHRLDAFDNNNVKNMWASDVHKYIFSTDKDFYGKIKSKQAINICHNFIYELIMGMI